MRSSVFSLGALLTLVWGCHGPALVADQATAPSQVPTVDLPPALARVLSAYETAWRAQDEAALAALFTEDGFVLSSGRPAVRGRANIEARYADSGGPLALRAWHFEVAGSTAIIIGGYSREAGEPDLGKFTLTLRERDDGGWLIASDMDNGNSRPPALQASPSTPANEAMASDPTPPAEHRHHSIDYLELAVTDMGAAQRFYTEAFGWEFTQYGPDYAGIKKPGGEAGGLRKEASVTRGGPLPVLFSQDLDATLAGVRGAGGEICAEPFEFPGGRRFHFLDPSGNELAVWAFPQ